MDLGTPKSTIGCIKIVDTYSSTSNWSTVHGSCSRCSFAEVVLAQQPTPILPDPKLTPGDTLDVTAEDLWYPDTGPGEYEIDHPIPLEPRGSNSIENLWPESHRTSSWNPRSKTDCKTSFIHWLVASSSIVLLGSLLFFFIPSCS
jgi:hypothetical protein